MSDCKVKDEHGWDHDEDHDQDERSEHNPRARFTVRPRPPGPPGNERGQGEDARCQEGDDGDGAEDLLRDERADDRRQSEHDRHDHRDGDLGAGEAENAIVHGSSDLRCASHPVVSGCEVNI